MMYRSPWRSLKRPRRDDEVSIPEGGMMVLPLNFFWEASLPAIWRSFIVSEEVLEKRKGIGRQCSGVSV